MTTPPKTAFSVIATAIRSQLLTDADLVALVTGTEVVETKMYLTAANGAANPPYVRYHHVYGGEPAKALSREFDQLWLVTAVAFDQPVSMNINNYLQNLLLGKRLTFTEGWLAWADITKNGEYSNITVIQGQEIYEIGAYYRIRGVKGN